MSLLTQFFQGRHKEKKDNQKNEKNQTIATIFSTTFQAPKIASSAPKKILRAEPAKKKKQIIQEQQSQIQEQAEQIQGFPLKSKNKKIKKQPKETNKAQAKQKKNKKNKILSQNTSDIKQDKQNTLQKQQQQEQKEQPQQNLDSTIFVGNIPLSSTHKTIKKYFEKYGKVLKVWFRSIPVQQSKIPKKGLHILKKYQQGADSMNGYVKFENQIDAKSAIKANGDQIQGHNIKVTMCKQFEIDYQTTIFIGNLPKKIKDQQLWDSFKSIGPIKSVRVVRNKQTFEGIGIGYVRFENKEDMKKAIAQMNGKMIGDRPMRIKKAVSKQRLEKKVKKVQQKKEKRKNGGQNFQKKSENTEKSKRAQEHEQKREKLDQKPNLNISKVNIGKFKHKPINKNFINKQINDQKYKSHYRSYNDNRAQSNQVVKTKYRFKGIKQSLQ